MEDPHCVSIADIFVLKFFCTLVESDWYLLFFFFWGDPGVENGLFFEIKVVIFDFESDINFEVDESCWVEGYVGVDVFLVVEAGIEIEYAVFGGYLNEF